MPDFFLAVDFFAPADFFLAPAFFLALMLSTNPGLSRPSALAAFVAAPFSALDIFSCFFVGFFLSQISFLATAQRYPRRSQTKPPLQSLNYVRPWCAHSSCNRRATTRFGIVGLVHVEPDRLRGADQRRGDERTGHSRRIASDQCGQHRGGRCQVHGAPDHRGRDDVVLELLVPEEDHDRDHAGESGLTEREHHEERPTEEATHLWDEVRDGSPQPASNASGTPRIRLAPRITVPLSRATDSEPAKYRAME